MSEEAKQEEARVIAPRKTEDFVQLEYPVTVDGELVTQVRIRRVTGVQVAEFMSAIGDPERAKQLVPVVVDCPWSVWSQLDDDDALRIEKAAFDFLPLRLRELLGLGESTQPSGDPS